MNEMLLNPGHTPGLFYSVAYFGACILFLALNEKRYKARWTILHSVLYFAGLSLFMYLTDGKESIAFALSMVTIFVAIFTFFRVLMKGNWRKAGYYAARSFILGEFAASLAWQLYCYSVLNLGFPAIRWLGDFLVVLIIGVVLTVTWFTESRFGENNKDLEITGQELTVVGFLTFIIFALSNLSFASPSTPFSGKYVMDVLAIRTLADLGGVALLYAYHLQICEVRGRMEKDYLNKLLHMQRENYRLSVDSVELINRKYHDLKHQLQILRSELSSEEKLSVLEELERDISSYEAMHQTGNKALDVVLSSKAVICQNAGISVTCVADGKEMDFMRTTDVSVLFGNALDNAIEGVIRLDSAEKRLIHISVARQKSFVRIRVENCCEEDVKFADGLPVTRKDPKYHGYGMKSIRSIVEKYEGSMTVKVQDGWFELRILIPVPESAEEGKKEAEEESKE